MAGKDSYSNQSKFQIETVGKGLLGDFTFAPRTFEGSQKAIQGLDTGNFRNKTEHDRYLEVCGALLGLIQSEPGQGFALGKVIDYIDRVNEKKLLDHPINLAKFEFYLNQFSGLSEEDNYKIRGKIGGKYVPRASYQPIFPVGQGQKYFGSHIVAAHHSPDVDTMIASFWGWLDAFSARLGRGLHIWSVPGGTPDCQVASVFKALFGKKVFEDLARPAMTVTLSSIDLATQDGVIKKEGGTLISDLIADSGRAILLVDEAGYFLGDWRSADVEGVRQVIMHFNSCVRWFENNLHATLILLFAKKDFQKGDLVPFAKEVFGLSIDRCDPVKDLSEAQLKSLDAFLRVIFGLEHGLHANFAEFGRAIAKIGLKGFDGFVEMLEQLGGSELFDGNGKVIESRPVLFTYLERIINEFDRAVSEIRRHLDRLDVAIRIKQDVLKIAPQFVTLSADVEQIRTKMEQSDYLPVVQEEKRGKYFPVGIVRAADARKPILGTVSLRDFSNFDEIKMASYLEVISVVDHHKSAVSTTATPMLIIGDAQSSNVLVAEQTILINDLFGLGGGTEEGIEKQLAELAVKGSGSKLTGAERRIQQRLLTRHMRMEHRDGYYVDPEREFSEYLFFLYAILDDTDLLSKVTVKDVDCVANLMNRLKSLMAGREVEVVNFDGIARDANFAKAAAKRLLQSEELYSIYKKTSEFKEAEVRENLIKCSHDEPSTIFADTKEQNGCCRVGQTKIFNQNYADYVKYADKVRRKWVEKAKQVNEAKGDVDLHMHMISTVVGAEEVYKGGSVKYGHRDEMWIWIPQTGVAEDHLTRFLNAWKDSAGMVGNPLEVAYLGGTEETMSRLISRSVGEIPVVRVSGEGEDAEVVVLYFNAGSMNSRKSGISPFLPKLVS